MLALAKSKLFGIPVAIFVWAAVSVVIAILLTRTAFGRAIYAIGTSERAAYLSGMRTRRVVIGAFVTSALCASVAGVLLAGYSAKAYQGMGNAYLLPSIAAVVLGGTHVLGGKGRYLGTLVGVILIVFLNSILSIMQMPEAFRQIIYGLVIVGMLLVYGRGENVTG
jgi:ribose transport system permease protein